MTDFATGLIALGALFLLGLVADQAGRRTRLPRVTLLLACGLAVGQAGFDLIPAEITALYPMVSVIALSMVAFLLGGALSLQTLRAHGTAILLISLSVVVVTLGMVSLGLWAMGLPLAAALVLGAIATATDPASTYDVLRETGADNSFTRTLKGIVAIDDAWGLVAFSLVMVIVLALTGSGEDGQVLGTAVYEIFGSVALGVAVGVPAAYLTGRLSDGEPLRIEALGLVFFTAGLSIWLGLSYLISGMTAGALIVNLARHHTKAFHEIEYIQWPFMVIFFILAGATLDPSMLLAIGPMGAAYVLLRLIARLVGGWIGGALAGVSPRQRPWFGPAMLPQAGVAIGIALLAAEHLPEFGSYILALTIGATVIFELIGPLATGFAVRKSIDAEGGDRAR
ncbi:cation:proton antiporter [Sedimentitalea todarodis]|uniref:Cation:proton antiporter n=1 Tax=Sedimentitalea todarodis TaxID=1631240 RepID=A0ABU3VAM0_9RHOB|nr:cation:proton antiporter [Sedimentitalea todarodis]MDU9003217.1 cation:proton antiporter [Sedimentitalea todarodis]